MFRGVANQATPFLIGSLEEDKAKFFRKWMNFRSMMLSFRSN